MILILPMPGQVVFAPGSTRAADLLAITLKPAPGPPDRRGPILALATVLYQDTGTAAVIDDATTLAVQYLEHEQLQITIVEPTGRAGG